MLVPRTGPRICILKHATKDSSVDGIIKSLEENGQTFCFFLPCKPSSSQTDQSPELEDVGLGQNPKFP